jgi:hypothetical protein
MGRALAVILVLGSLVLFLNVYTQGVDRAFGGAFARLLPGEDPMSGWPAEPVPRRTVSERVEREGRTLAPIGQRVRERVSGAMQEGARRHGGGG